MAEKNPVALVVGAGDFIGSAVSRRFAKGGYTVCAARRNADRLAGLIAEIEADGGRAHGLAMDARQEEQVVDTFARIEADIGPLEVVVFNPGGNVNAPIRETTTRVFAKVWLMACFGGFLTGREAAKYMAPRGKGTILFTGATASMRGGAGFAAFSSAKSGLRALAQSMARELGPAGVHVAHVVIDAAVDTEWVRGMIAKARGIAPSDVPEDFLMKPASIADAYFSVHSQPRDAWTFELDLRPFGEKW